MFLAVKKLANAGKDALCIAFPCLKVSSLEYYCSHHYVTLNSIRTMPYETHATSLARILSGARIRIAFSV